MKIMFNKGTGAGGKNTNKNGLVFENVLQNHIQGNIYNGYTYLEKTDFCNHMKDLYRDSIKSKNFRPDGAFVSKDRKNVFILECKFQQCLGSIDEKILNGPIKRELYRMKYPEVDEFKYGFVLSPWYKQESYDSWINILKLYGIKIFFTEHNDTPITLKLNYHHEKIKLEINYTLYTLDFRPIDDWLK